MWFKKKSVLQGEGNYNSNTAEDGIDWRQTNTGRTFRTVSQTLPSAADAGNYFYLPALGIYDSGRLLNVGGVGYYWSSSAHPWYSDYAYCLRFDNGYVYIDYNYRLNGCRVDGFQ